MLALATQNDFRQIVSTFELDAPDRRYTVELSRIFRQSLGSQRSYFSSWGLIPGPRLRPGATGTAAFDDQSHSRHTA